MKELPSWPVFTDEDIDAVTRVLRSGKVNYWTGTEGRKFEQEYSASLGSDYGIAVANGSVALELALKAIRIERDDEVIVTPRSFIASASCVSVCGARPIFADVDKNSGNITAETIEAVVTDRTKAIIPVHLGGWPCEMDEIKELARSRGLAVLEDCAQAHGATYKDQHVGTLGDIGAFSFCQDKIITTGGEGGLVVTSDNELWNAMWSYKDHGKSFDTVFRRDHPPGFRWLHENVGTNWRMTEMQAAIGRIWLSRLGELVERRRRNARILTEALCGYKGLRIPEVPSYSAHSYYRFYAYISPEGLRSGWNRDRVMTEISAQGVPCFSGTCSEIYREKTFDSHNSRPVELPVTRELGETSLMFPVYPTMSEDDMGLIARAAVTTLEMASK
ncbi:DegT/DnrJ/EryC1/StrS family aminotransferase [Verrucomicrobia bacterium]|nr:DegT/DnrJ/EryC1/StrS family aminotransferase [Verrucomicrobiota bacterium]MDA7657493.1 DegT/DnrJ/EryC1/StrS family aminotransferase [Verrucomicrobiota bacterium]